MSYKNAKINIMFSKRCSGKIYVYQNKSRKIKKNLIEVYKKTFDWGFWEQNWRKKKTNCVCCFIKNKALNQIEYYTNYVSKTVFI